MTIKPTEVPETFTLQMIREGDSLICYGHNGLPVYTGFDLSEDPKETAVRANVLRHAIFWHVEMARRGFDHSIAGQA